MYLNKEDLCFWQWWDNRDQIYHTDSYNQKTRQNTGNNSFKTLDIRQQRIVFPNKKQVKWTLKSSQVITLRKFPGHITEKETQPQPCILPELRRKIEIPERLKQLGFQERGENYTDREHQSSETPL